MGQESYLPYRVVQLIIKWDNTSAVPCMMPGTEQHLIKRAIITVVIENRLAFIREQKRHKGLDRNVHALLGRDLPVACYQPLEHFSPHIYDMPVPTGVGARGLVTTKGTGLAGLTWMLVVEDLKTAEEIIPTQNIQCL